MAEEQDLDRAAPELLSRLRVAALLALAAAAVFIPIEAYVGLGEARAVLLPWVVHVLLDVLALIASRRPLTATQADRLVLAVLCGHVLNGLFYLALVPERSGLVADGLTCLLVVGVVLFSWSEGRALGVAVGTVAGFVVVGIWTAPDHRPTGPLAVAAGALVVGAAIAVASARVLGRLRGSLARRHEELAALSARLMSVQEEERRRLARELHDELGQSLTAVNACLWLLERQSPGDVEGLRSRTAEARHLVAQTLGAMRALSELLRPSVLDSVGLAASLDSHLKAFAERHAVETRLATDGLPERLPPEVETALYRITQEALTNVARHAHARRVTVSLGMRGSGVWLEVADDGIGLRAAEGGRRGTGLVGIRERAHALGGTVRVESAGGVRLRVELPVPR